MKACSPIILLLLSAALLPAFSQVKLNEGFESSSFSPPGWTTHNQSGPEQWSRITGMANGPSAFFAGSACAFINYEVNGGEDWLITPQLTNILATDTLFFTVARQYSGAFPPDSLVILLSTTTNAPSGFTTRLGALSVPSLPFGSWVSFRAPLSGFASQHIYLAFVHKNINGHGMFLDEVKVSSPLPSDVAVSAIHQTGKVFTKPTMPVQMSGIVRNNGLSPATFNVVRTISPGNYSSTQTVSSLAPGAQARVFFTDFTTYATGTVYTIKDSVYLPGDGNASNDTLNGSFTVAHARNTLIYYQDTVNRDSLVAHFIRNGMNGQFDTLQWSNTRSLHPWKSLVVACANGSVFSNSIKDSIKAYIDHSAPADKRTLVLFGNDVGYVFDRAASPSRDTTFYRQYLRSVYLEDNWISDIPSANRRFNAFGPFSSIATDSLSDQYPDYVKPHQGGQAAFAPAYPGATGDTACAVYYSGTGYNLFYGTNVYAGYRRMPQQVLAYIAGWTAANGGLLPVTFAWFSGKALGNDVLLSWATSGEKNNAGFTVERSTDGFSFSDLAFITAAGNAATLSSYTFTDKAAPLLAQGLYYRIRQTDRDGSTGFSDVIFVSNGTTGAFRNISVSPNPFTSSFRLSFSGSRSCDARIRVYNASGILVSGQTMPVTAGENTVNIDKLGMLDPGFYFVELEAGSQVVHYKVLKSE